MINMHRAARHLAQYRFGYLAAGFLLIAALTFGVRLGAGVPQEELDGMSVALTGWGPLYKPVSEHHLQIRRNAYWLQLYFLSDLHSVSLFQKQHLAR